MVSASLPGSLPKRDSTAAWSMASATMSIIRVYHGVRPRYSVTVSSPSFAYSAAPNMLAGPRSPVGSVRFAGTAPMALV